MIFKVGKYNYNCHRFVDLNYYFNYIFFFTCNYCFFRFNKINGKGFLEKQKDETQDTILKRIKDVVSETLKLKYNLFLKEARLKDYSK